MMRLPVRVFSDLHLGHKASRIDRVEKLRPLLCGAGTVIFNGDTWQELSRPWRERSANMLGELRALGADEGCEMMFLPGNHDPGWDGPGFINLAEGRIVITHGDSLFFDSSPWKREVMLARESIEEMWRGFPAADHDVNARLELAKEIARRLPTCRHPEARSFVSRVWDAVTPPRRALNILRAWFGQGEMGARFCERYFPQAELLLIGHFHRSGIWKARGKTICNTGSFVVPGRACWAEWNGRSLSCGRVDESGSQYGFRRSGGRSFFFGEAET